MARVQILLAVLVTLLAAPGYTVAELRVGYGRSLAETEAALPTDEQIEFQVVSQCKTGDWYYVNDRNGNKPGAVPYNVVNIDASIEMDPIPDIMRIFNASDPFTWDSGNSRINVSVLLAPKANASLPRTLIAQVHTQSCSKWAAGGKGYFSGYTLFAQEVRAGNSSNETTVATITGNLPLYDTNYAANSFQVPFLVDYDLTQALVVLDTNAPESFAVACCDLIPPFPTFPDEWTATIEANIVNKGYTVVQREYWSQPRSQVRLDVHSYATDRSFVADVSKQQMTVITPNTAAHPNGQCRRQPFDDNTGGFKQVTQNSTDGPRLVSTAQFLQFVNSDGVSVAYVPGHYDVRGIQCEMWTTTMNIPEANATYKIDYYFPVNQWLVARETFHRMIKRITLTGTRAGQEIDHQYEFVNFRPYVASPKVFDVCGIAPQGDGCNCSREAAADALLDGRANADVVDAQSVRNATGGQSVQTRVSDVSSLLDSGCAPSGFTSSQGGPYAALAVGGLAVGVLLGLLGACLLARCCGRSRGFQRSKGEGSAQDWPVRNPLWVNKPKDEPMIPEDVTRSA